MSDPRSDPDAMIDTQVVSYAMKKRWPQGVEARDISGLTISSVTAQELLEVRGATRERSPRYYLFQPLLPEAQGAPIPASYDRDHRKVSPGRKNRTDRVILDFGNDFPTVVEYGHLMIGWLLKYKRVDAYMRRISHLEKDERRRLQDIFIFMVESELRCVSLDRDKAQLGVDLLRQYAIEDGNSLKANFRNSLNDMLILASAMSSDHQLVTEDRALWRFAARVLGLAVDSKEPLLRLSPSHSMSGGFASRESKGYINQPWRAHVTSHKIPL